MEPQQFSSLCDALRKTNASTEITLPTIFDAIKSECHMKKIFNFPSANKILF